MSWASVGGGVGEEFQLEQGRGVAVTGISEQAVQCGWAGGGLDVVEGLPWQRGVTQRSFLSSLLPSGSLQRLRVERPRSRPPASFVPLGAGRRRHRHGGDSETSLAKPGREPQPTSYHAGEVLPGAELPGVRGGPGPGAAGVPGPLPAARPPSEPARGPARGRLQEPVSAPQPLTPLAALRFR